MLRRADSRRLARFVDVGAASVLKAVDDEAAWLLGPRGLEAIDWRTGEPVASIALDPAPVGLGYACFREGDAWLCRSSDGRAVSAFDARGGEHLWSVPNDARVRTVLASRGGRFLALATRGALALAWIDATSGVTLEELTLDGTMHLVEPRAAIVGDVLVLMTDDRTLIGVAMDPLTVLWTRRLHDAVRVDRALPPVALGDRVVLVAVAEASHGPVTILATIDPSSGEVHLESEIDGETDRVEANATSLLAFFTGTRGRRFAMHVPFVSGGPPRLLDAPKRVASSGSTFLLASDERVEMLFDHGDRVAWLAGALPPGVVGAPIVARGRAFFTLNHRLLQLDCRAPVVALGPRDALPAFERPHAFDLVLEPIAGRAAPRTLTPRVPVAKEQSLGRPAIRAIDRGHEGAVVLPPANVPREPARFFDALRLAPIERATGARLPPLLATLLARSDRDRLFAARLHRLGLHLDAALDPNATFHDARVVALGSTSDDERLALLVDEEARAQPIVDVARGADRAQWIASDFATFFARFLRERERTMPALVDAVRADLGLDADASPTLPEPAI